MSDQRTAGATNVKDEAAKPMARLPSRPVTVKGLEMLPALAVGARLLPPDPRLLHLSVIHDNSTPTTVAG